LKKWYEVQPSKKEKNQQTMNSETIISLHNNNKKSLTLIKNNVFNKKRDCTTKKFFINTIFFIGIFYIKIYFRSGGCGCKKSKEGVTIKNKSTLVGFALCST